MSAIEAPDMTAEDVAVVRRALDGFNARDIEGVLHLFDADAELYPLRAQLEGKVYRGPEGLRELMADLEQDWEYVRLEIDEIREGEEGRIAVLGHLHSRGRASGVDVDVPMGWAWLIRGGKIVYSRAFSEPADALRDANLEPGSAA